MASDFYETHFLQYRNRTVNIDPSPFLALLTCHLQKGATVLDVGCGSGRDLLWLKKQGYKTTGFERSSGLAELAGRHADCPVIEGDFTAFDFSVFQFDAILFIGSLVHLQRTDFAPTLARIVRAVRGNGLIYLTLKEGEGEARNKDDRIFTLWNHEDLEEIFAALGFKILDFSRNISSLDQKDIWLGYVLRNKG